MKKIICLFSVVLLLMGVIVCPVSADEDPDGASTITYEFDIGIFDTDETYICGAVEYVGVGDAIPYLWVVYDEPNGKITFAIASAVELYDEGWVDFDDRTLGGEFVGLSERPNGIEQNVLSYYDPYWDNTDVAVLARIPLTPEEGYGAPFGIYDQGTYRLNLHCLRVPSISLGEQNNQAVIDRAEDVWSDIEAGTDYLDRFSPDIIINTDDLSGVVEQAFYYMRELANIPLVSTIMTLSITIGVMGFVLYGKR